MATDALTDNSLPASSDSGIKVIVRMRPFSLMGFSSSSPSSWFEFANAGGTRRRQRHFGWRLVVEQGGVLSFLIPGSFTHGGEAIWRHRDHGKASPRRKGVSRQSISASPLFVQLATYPAPANIVVVKEFYSNAKKIGDYPAENYLGYVRGHAIRYDPDSINNFLDTVWAGEQCQFALCMEEGADYEDVERVLCIPGGHFQRNRSGSVVNIRRTDLTPLAKYWMEFSHPNIQPCSHVSDITLSRALFIYCAIRNLNVNIGQVIADEISVCANTSNNKAPLGHPSLITHLCKLAGVDTSVPPFERPRKAIDEAYYRQYCGGEDAAQPVPPRHARRERGPAQSYTSAETHEAEPFQMRDMYMSLIGAQLQSIHRGQVATAEMIVGMYDTPPAHRWTMDEFHNVVAWPEEPEHGGGAEAAEASVREKEEDEADDDEDEEEEEDTEDSSD
ncbi:hypothetical protein LR48_Vigan312s000400 [Vigna angularis]|uniref:Putative plant transposon protein domain-containing protein n=1 Tax=Phaseolus angularis TaxID=3914 RepID=A0A0L9T840_PHAAN|nr:hypothetical protein LR48_Vigan312s000400 [Vigna angularis]